MAVVGDISQITLPGGNTYDIKDSVARSAINGIFVIAWNGTGTATAANVPAGVVAGTVTGTLAAGPSTLGKFYLVKSSSQQDPTLLDIYDEYVTIRAGTSPNYTYSWEKIGDTQIKLTAIVTDVTLNKQTTNFVTGYSSTTSANVIGANSTFTVTQPVYSNLSQTYLGATSAKPTIDDSKAFNAVTGYSPSSDSFVSEINVTNTNKLVTTTVKGISGSSSPGVLNTATVSGEVLTIGSTNLTIPTAAANATTVATGSIASNGAGSAVVTNVTATPGTALTGLGTPTTSSAMGSGATFNAPAITLAANTSSATGRVQVTTGKEISATTNVGVAWNSKDQKSALTGLGSPSTAAGLNNSTTITVTHPS